MPGKYHLDHNQKGNDWDYFKLAVQKDVPVTITVASSLNGITYDPKKGVFLPDLRAGYASTQLIAADRSAIGRAAVTTIGGKDSETFKPTSSGFIYLRVGPYYSNCVECSMTKESTFEIQAGSAPQASGAVTDSSAPTTGAPDTSANSGTVPEPVSLLNLPGNTLLYVGMGMAALIVILLVVVVMMLLNKKTPPPPPPPVAPQVPPTIPPTA
jgi:hypothetical protein